MANRNRAITHFKDTLLLYANILPHSDKSYYLRSVSLGVGRVKLASDVTRTLSSAIKQFVLLPTCSPDVIVLS